MTAGTAERMTDAALAAGFLRDPELFTEVHDRYFRVVYRYVAGRLGPQVAEDIAAETFLVAFDRRRTFDPERGDVRVWLFGIATNLLPGGARLVVDPATGRVNRTSTYVVMEAAHGVADPDGARITAEWTSTTPS